MKGEYEQDTLSVSVEVCLIVFLWLSAFVGERLSETFLANAGTRGESPRAIPTFHCLGIYWSPPAGSPDKAVLVRYRRQGESH